MWIVKDRNSFPAEKLEGSFFFPNFAEERQPKRKEEDHGQIYPF